MFGRTFNRMREIEHILIIFLAIKTSSNISLDALSGSFFVH